MSKSPGTRKRRGVNKYADLVAQRIGVSFEDARDRVLGWDRDGLDWRKALADLPWFGQRREA